MTENLHDKFADTQQLMATQHGELLDALSTLSTKLSQVIAAINAIPGGGTDMSATIAKLDQIYSRLGATNLAIGSPGDAAIGTVIELLTRSWAVQRDQLECCQDSSGQPPASGIGGCTAPVVSTGIRARQVFIAPSGGNPGVAFFYNVATFTIPISDDLTGDIGLGAEWEDGYIAAPRDGWDGWRVYVQSDAPSYTDDPDGIPIYPVSAWRALTGSTSRMFSVSPPHQIKVFLCPPGDTGGGPTIDCTTADSQAVTALPPTAGVPVRQMAIIPGWPDVQDEIVINPDSYTARFEEPCIHYGTLEGYQVSSIEGRIRVIWRASTVGDTSVQVLNTGESLTLPANTYCVLFDDFVNPDAATSGPFTVELCPPSPE